MWPYYQCREMALPHAIPRQLTHNSSIKQRSAGSCAGWWFSSHLCWSPFLKIFRIRGGGYDRWWRQTCNNPHVGQQWLEVKLRIDLSIGTQKVFLFYTSQNEPQSSKYVTSWTFVQQRASLQTHRHRHAHTHRHRERHTHTCRWQSCEMSRIWRIYPCKKIGRLG